jgi:signal transduction histidine kinase
MYRVLIVDDEKSIRITLREFLRQEDYEVEMAEEAEIAIRLMKEKPFDIVISDIILPKITGVQLLKSISEISPETKVILITGEPTVETAAEALRTGAHDYLYKPVNKAVIVKAVANAVKVKELEDANREYRENLERKVEERTRELKKMLEEQKQMQEKITQQDRLAALGRIASGIAHDINNTLSPISIYSQVILEQEKNLSGESKKFLGLILKAATDIENTILRMRQFYNDEKPADSIFTNISVEDAVKDAIDISRNKVASVREKNGIAIAIDAVMEKGMPPMAGIESEIRSVLVNLLFNAADAMDKDGHISIRARIKDPHIIIEIEDEGTGMDEEQKKHCLDPFYTTKGTEGSGLGLSSVHGIVQRHNGKLEIESTKGKGTKISLLLSIGDPVKSGPPDATTIDELSNLHILIIDDEPIVRDVLQVMLELNGHQIVAASSGEEGVALYNSAQNGGTKFDLVISDLGMPGMDGKAVAKKIKEINRNMPFILLSGWGKLMKEDIEDDSNIDAVLGKPLKLPELESAMQVLMVKNQA